MEIKLLAFDSFGVRSMSTFIQTNDVLLHIDPSASLAPNRYGLPPHRKEVERLLECSKVIEDFARESKMIIITHYHYDHHDPGYLIPLDIYKNKVVYVKNPEEKINRSQMMRAKYFLNLIKPIAKEVRIAEGSEIRVGGTTIRISNPVPHGVNDRLGYVVEVSVSNGSTKVVYTSDVEGPPLEEQVDFILIEKPDTLIIDGPMTCMLGFRYSRKALQASVENLKKVIEVGVKRIVIDHHFLRDVNCWNRIVELHQHAKERGSEMITAAEFMNRPIEMLEALRNKLYQEKPEEIKIPEKLKSLLEE